MALENITGDLLAYKELEQGTFQHVDQLTTERRTNQGLRNQAFYTADGELYTLERGKPLWVITREPQNLVLQNIDEAYRQLRSQGNYFPDTQSAQDSSAHPQSVAVSLEELNLVRNNDEYGHFVLDPRNVKKLNAEQRKAAQRIYGPDEENFGLNMKMFAEAGKTPSVFGLMPDYVQGTLRSNDKKFLGRASWLRSFNDYFYANDRYVYNLNALRGVRREVAVGDAPKNEAPPTPKETGRVTSPTMEDILAVSRQHIPPLGWERFQAEIGKLYKP